MNWKMSVSWKKKIDVVVLQWLNSDWFGIKDKNDLNYIIEQICNKYLNQNYCSLQASNDILDVLENIKGKFSKKILKETT